MEGEAKRIGFYLEKYYPKVSSLTGNYLYKTIVGLHDVGMESNGFTDPLVPSIHIFAAQPYPSQEFGAMRSWWREVCVHEFTHASHLSRTSGITKIMRVLIGRAFLPNLLTPSFLTEGIAVYSESTLLPYEGRLNEGFFESYIKNSLPFSLSFLMGEPLVYPYSSMRYIYGGEFIKYLAEKYGEEKIEDFIKSYSGSLWQFLGITPKAYKRIFGRGLSKLYRDFSEEWKNGRKLKGIFEADNLMWMSSGGGKLYISKLDLSFPFPQFHIPTYSIIELNPESGKHRVISRDPVSLPMRYENGNLYYARTELRRGFKNKINLSYGESREIIKINLKTGKKEKILKGLIRAFDVKDGKILYSLPYKCCGSELFVYNPKNRKSELLLKSDKIEFYDIAWGKEIILGGRKDGEGSDLYVLKNGNAERLTQTPFTETNLRWEGDLLIFSANPDGLWKAYSLRDGKFLRLSDSDLCESPSISGKNLYCISIVSGRKKVIKEKVKNSVEKWNPPPYSADQRSLEFSKASTIYNTITLFIPDLYYFSYENEAFKFNAIGHDALEENFYLFSIGSKENYGTVWNFNLSSLSLSPFLMNLSFKNEEEKSMDFNLSYPVFMSSRKFLRSCFLNLGLSDKLSIERRAATSISWDLIFKSKNNKFQVYLEPELDLEGLWTGSTIKRKGYFLQGGFLYSLSKKTGVYCSLSYGKDRKNPEGIDFRTFSWGRINKREGILAYDELSYRLLNIRKGIANPHFFLDGLYLSAFSEAIAGEGSHRESLGGFLSLEISAYHGLARFYPMAGVAYRFDERRWTGIWGINGFLYPFQLFRKSSSLKKTLRAKEINKFYGGII